MPLIALDVPPPRRARLVWMLFAALTLAALAWPSSGPPLACRLLAGVGALALGWRGARAVLFGFGRAAVFAFEWLEGGEWRIRLGDGRWRPVRLSDATVTLGPWILMAWDPTEGDDRPRARRYYALVEAAGVGREAFRTLKGRLAVTGGRPSGRRSRRWRGDN